MKTIKAFLLGMWEFRTDFTWADPARTDDCWYTDLDAAYDFGRELAHRLTFRRYE
jgi:hypothetical protein